MEMEYFWTSGPEKKLRLNFLHVKRGTVICSVEGTYQLQKGMLDISFP